MGMFRWSKFLMVAVVTVVVLIGLTGIAEIDLGEDALSGDAKRSGAKSKKSSARETGYEVAVTNSAETNTANSKSRTSKSSGTSDTESIFDTPKIRGGEGERYGVWWAEVDYEPVSGDGIYTLSRFDTGGVAYYSEICSGYEVQERDTCSEIGTMYVELDEEVVDGKFWATYCCSEGQGVWTPTPDGSSAAESNAASEFMAWVESAAGEGCGDGTSILGNSFTAEIGGDTCRYECNSDSYSNTNPSAGWGGDLINSECFDDANLEANACMQEVSDEYTECRNACDEAANKAAERGDSFDLENCAGNDPGGCGYSYNRGTDRCEDAQQDDYNQCYEGENSQC
jgi:hypothetical protein